MKFIKISLLFFALYCLTNQKALGEQNTNRLQQINPEKVQIDNLFPRFKLETSAGNIVIELDRNRAPITTNNFIKYAVSGHYDGTIFHRIVADFVVQGGGYDLLYQAREQLKPIFNESGNGLKNEIYTISMARENGQHSATNQFFFNLADNINLDPSRTWGYAVFGLVMEGTEVLDLIGKSKTHYHSKLGWDEVPINAILLKKVTLLAEEQY